MLVREVGLFFIFYKWLWFVSIPEAWKSLQLVSRQCESSDYIVKEK